MNIRSGLNVDIVTNADWSAEDIDVRKATVFDIDDQKIIISQTSFPMPRYYIGKRIKITYLTRVRGSLARYCISGRLNEIVSEYKLSGSTESTEALIVLREPGCEPFNLRLFYRLRPPTGSGIALFINNKKVNIIDISIGGAKFTHDVIPNKVKPKEKIQMMLHIDQQYFDTEARVMRVETKDIRISGQIVKKLETISVQFLNPERNMKDLLSKKIRYIEREISYREKYE